MAIQFKTPGVYGDPGLFVQDLMTTTQQVYGSGTMNVNGKAPLVDRGSSKFFAMSDEVFFNGYAVPGSSPPFVVWRVKDMLFERIKQTGGWNGSVTDMGSGDPQFAGFLNGTIGSLMTTLEVKVTGRNAAEALNETKMILTALELFPCNPPVSRQTIHPLNQGNVQSNGFYTYIFSFQLPLIVDPAPLSTPVLIHTASAGITGSLNNVSYIQKRVAVFGSSSL